MKLCIRATSCRHQELLRHFQCGSTSESANYPTGHFCCDICRESCSCSGGHCIVPLKMPIGEKNIEHGEISNNERKVTDSQKLLLTEKLTLMAKIIATQSKSPRSVISANALMQFDSDQVTQVVDNCHLLFSQEDVMKHVDIWKRTHAQMILNIIGNIFHDIEVMDCDLDDDEIEDDIDNYDEWDDIVNDDSFLSLINQTSYHMETFSDLEQSTVVEEATYPSFLDSIIRNVDEN